MVRLLALRDFRNYSSTDVEFQASIVIFVGANGQGKSNLLEAIFFLGNLRSFRTTNIRSLARVGEEGFALSAMIDTGLAWERSLDVKYGRKRELRVDGALVRKASEFIGYLPVVVFSPADIMLVTESSAPRRRFLNMFLATSDRGYLAALNDYAEALAARNALLKGNTANPAELTVFEQILAIKGAVIVCKRKNAIEAMSRKMAVAHSSIVRCNQGALALRYQFSQVCANPETYVAKLAADRSKDSARGATSLGPHLDDIEFLLDGKSLRAYGSTGQCRLAALCLKMAAVDMLDEPTDSKGVVTLIDDVTGDLDEPTREAFLGVVDRSMQSFLTFTEPPSDGRFDSADVFSVENGLLEKF